ncbi:hypothetical protein LINGRAHAP2_LOCUS10658 [Linum grandiflorum]
MWRNTNLLVRLDRVVINEELLLAFPESSTYHLPRIKSDHRLINVSIYAASSPTKSLRSSHFNAAWLCHEDFHRLIKEEWTSGKCIVWSLQMFDMLPRPQGIVIREPVQEEDYLEQNSPDSVLFKTPATVLQELFGNQISPDEIMEEQCAIEAGFKSFIVLKLILINLYHSLLIHKIPDLSLSNRVTNVVNACCFLAFFSHSGSFPGVISDLLSQKLNDPAQTLA